MNKKIYFILFLFFFIFGCLKNIDDLEEAQYLLIQERISVLLNQECSCFVCVKSEGFFDYAQDLVQGGCHIRENCNPHYLTELSHATSNSFLRTFDIGMGNTFFEYEEASLRSSLGLGIVLRELKQRDLPKSGQYILPLYQGDAVTVRTPVLARTFADIAKIPAFRALEKNTLPIYYFNSEDLTVEWLDKFFENTEIETTPSFIAVKSSALNVNDLIKQINNKCTDEERHITVQRCVEASPPNVPEGQTVPSNLDECSKFESVSILQYGCKSMLYIDHMINASDIDYSEIFDKINEIDEEHIEGINTFLLHINITEEDACHAAMVSVQAMNLSRTLMYTYGTKPSYLIVSMDDYCRENHEDQIAQALYSSIYYMRMTGIMGMVYYDYLSSSTEIEEEIEKPKTFLQLNNYYYNYTYGYNREPLLFDSDGMNISKLCDTRSQKSTLSIDMNVIRDISLSRIEPNPHNLQTLDEAGDANWYYVYAIPMLDYGKWAKFFHLTWEDTSGEEDDTGFWGTFCDYTSPKYRKVHLDAEKCGVSNYLLLSFEKNNVRFDCDEWYDMIDDFVSKGEIDVQNVQTLDMDTMKQLSFAYLMPQGNREILSLSEMRTYCYGTFNEPAVNPQICEILNDYLDIRGYFLEYIFYPTCWSYRIGYHHHG